MKTRRVIALLVAIMTLVTATASAEWFYAGLDTRNVDTVDPVLSGINRVYNEIIDGNYTGKVKSVPFTLQEYIELNVGWAFESYEFDYPHAGYDRLYVDGEPMANTKYNNMFPQWETKFADYIWEIANERIVDTETGDVYTGHRVWQRQMTKIPGYGWVWDFGKNVADEQKVYVPTTRMADVAETYKITGFANLKLNGEKLFEITEDKQLLIPEIRGQYNAINLYKDFGRFHTIEEFAAAIDYNWEDFVVESGLFSAASLSELDEYGEYVVSDLDIKEALAPYTVATKWLDGPSYNGESGVKDVASLYIEDLKILEDGTDISVNPMWKWEDGHIDWKWDTDTVAAGIPVYKKTSNCLVCGILNDCDICNFEYELVDYNNIDVAWTEPDYEVTTPYGYYQFLIVNGIVFDGTKDTPRIYRYTQGVASPKVEWKYTPWTELLAAYGLEVNDLDATANDTILDIIASAVDVPSTYNDYDVAGLAGILEVVEWKYVDGKPVRYTDGTPVIRIPTGEYAKCFVKITEDFLEIWRDTVHGEELAIKVPMDASFKWGYNGFTSGATNVAWGYVEPETY